MLVPYKPVGRWGYVSRILCVCVFRVEKYRPTKLDDLISHEDIIATSMYYKFIHYIFCMNNLKSYDRAVWFHCILVVAEILNRENVRWKWRTVALKSEIVLFIAMWIYLRGNGVFGPELYFRSRHQLHRIMAMDTQVFTLVVERNQAFGKHLARYTEIFGEKLVHVLLCLHLWWTKWYWDGVFMENFGCPLPALLT